MTARWFVFLAIAGLGWVAEAAAQTPPACPNNAPRSAAGICPVFVQGDPTCVEAAQICGIGVEDLASVSPLPNSDNGVSFTVSGTSAVVKDTFTTPNQQTGRPGFEAIIARRNGAYIYCGIEILNDLVKAPGPGAPNQVTVCFAKGPCEQTTTQVSAACAAYGGAASFLQAYNIGPLEQTVNICGCSPSVARFCDPRPPIYADPPTNAVPRFAACNPGAIDEVTLTKYPQAPFKALEAEGTATIGINTCVLRTIGGRRILVNSTTGTLC